MSRVTTTSPLRVVVAGGGIAGIEALLALRELAGDRLETVLLDSRTSSTGRSRSAEPFGLGHAERVPLDRIARDAGATWVRGALAVGRRRRRVVRTRRARSSVRRADRRDRRGADRGAGGRRDVVAGRRPREPRRLLRDVEGGSPERRVPRAERARLAAAGVRARAHDRARGGAAWARRASTSRSSRPRPSRSRLRPEASRRWPRSSSAPGVRLVAGTVAELRRVPEGTEVARPEAATVVRP